MVRARGWLTASWDLIGADLPVFAVAGFLTISVSLVTLFIMAMPLVTGLCIMFSEKLQGNKPQLAHLWEGAGSRFPAAISIWVVMMLAALPFDATNAYLHDMKGALPTIGVVVVFLGLWLVSTPLFFCLPTIADRDVSARDALRLSWAQVRPRWGGILAAVIVYSIVMLFGIIACGVGIIITLPLVVGAQMLAYREYFRDFEVPQLIPIKEPVASEGEEDAKD
jgi:hypothetical protein